MRKALIVSLALFFTPAFPVGAAPLTVVTDENLPPYSYLRGNVAIGIDVDMLREAATRLKIDISISALPWKRALLSIERGESQLGMPLFRTPERAQYALFTAPVHYSTTGLFVKKGREFRFDSVSDLSGKRLGYNRGYALPEELDEAIKKGRLAGEEVSTTSQNIAKLMLGRIDVFAANTINTQFVMRETSAQKDIAQLPHPLSQKRPAYLVVSKSADLPGKNELVAALTQELEKLHRDGTYERIVKRYTQ